MTVSPDFDPRPVTLANEFVLVEPLAAAHAEDLLAAGREEDISALTIRPAFTDLDVVRSWIDETLADAADGAQIPFAIRDHASGQVVGSTRFIELRRAHRALEIGYTWVGRDWQRTAVNTACKLLLLEHVFETLGANRVQFKTDRRNERSQRALERIGAVFEGVLRRHMVLPDGQVRDSVCYSVVAEEWPRIRVHLEGLLSAHE